MATAKTVSTAKHTVTPMQSLTAGMVAGGLEGSIHIQLIIRCNNLSNRFIENETIILRFLSDFTSRVHKDTTSTTRESL